MDTTNFLLFVVAATALAITPGPGILYVAARTLAAGRAEGLASSFGTAFGGMIHVFGGAIGLSALLMASAEAFTILKVIGALYLLWIGYKTIREARADIEVNVEVAGVSKAFRDGILVEALNPKTAAFFLGFIPQFIEPAGNVAVQFVALGTCAVVLNTLADIIVTLMATAARGNFANRPHLIRRLRMGSGGLMCALGGVLLLARRTS